MVLNLELTATALTAPGYKLPPADRAKIISESTLFRSDRKIDRQLVEFKKRNGGDPFGLQNSA